MKKKEKVLEYKCMTCNKEYFSDNLPIIGKSDGCCSTGSLIEIGGYNHVS